MPLKAHMLASLAALGLCVGILFTGRAHALNLGGKDIPREKIIVYLFIGHSNMAGRSLPNDTATHPRAWNYKIPDYGSQFTGWILAKDPIHQDIRNATKGGPGMPFLKKMVEYFPDHYIGIVQNANSGHRIDRHYRRSLGIAIP